MPGADDPRRDEKLRAVVDSWFGGRKATQAELTALSDLFASETSDVLLQALYLGRATKAPIAHFAATLSRKR